MLSMSRIVALRLLTALALLPAAARAAAPPATEAASFMVVTAQHLATEAGLAMLRAGGNAVDAAVAVGYAEAVVNPCCGNIGGGGFMTLHLAPAGEHARDVFLNFRETAPAAATRDMYLDADGKVIPESSLYGWRAVAVPGTVLGLDAALTRYGSLSRAQEIATTGGTHMLIASGKIEHPLQAIADGGPDVFYRGRIAEAVAAASRTGGGLITAADFAAYTVTEGAPLTCAYRGYTVLSAPPPSSGGATLCEILNILEGYDLRGLGFHAAASVHLMTEAMRHAFLDRNTYLGDPAFVHNPLDRLLSKDYAAEIRARIGERATPSAELRPGVAPHEQAETTHYSVIDKAGNAVAVTYTVNGLFGAVVMAPGTGFVLNDEMDDFTVKPGTPNMFGLVQGATNAIAPGKRPLSSMAPTIVMKDNKVAMVLGSPGGSRIITITLETALNMIDYDMTPQEAVDAPRLHHQWLPDEIDAEPFALSPDTAERLRALGYTIVTQSPWGAAELIAVRPGAPAAGAAASGNDAALSGGMRPGLLYGANDSRRPAGSAEGY